MLCNGFRSALRHNTATANSETQYSKIHKYSVQNTPSNYTKYIKQTHSKFINRLKSALRSNSATSNGETEYNKIYIVFVEVEHAKYSTTLYTQNAEYGNKEIQQYVTALGSGQVAELLELNNQVFSLFFRMQNFNKVNKLLIFF